MKISLKLLHFSFAFIVLVYTLVFLIRYHKEEINFEKNNVCEESVKHMSIPYISYVYNFVVLIVYCSLIRNMFKKKEIEQKDEKKEKEKILLKSWVMGFVALNIVLLFEAYSLLVNVAISCGVYNAGISASGFLILSLFQFVTIFYLDLYDDRDDDKKLKEATEKLSQDIRKWIRQYFYSPERIEGVKEITEQEEFYDIDRKESMSTNVSSYHDVVEQN